VIVLMGNISIYHWMDPLPSLPPVAPLPALPLVPQLPPLPSVAVSQSSPPAPTLSYTDLHRELMNEIRWRRDSEFKLLAVQTALATALIAIVLKAQDQTGWTQIVTSLTSIFLISAFSLICGLKVSREHEHGSYLGSILVRLWDSAGFFQESPNVFKSKDRLLGKRSEHFGQGGGYLITLSFVAVSWILVMLLSGWTFVLGVCHHCSKA
jgi:hypothetical protein